MMVSTMIGVAVVATFVLVSSGVPATSAAAIRAVRRRPPLAVSVTRSPPADSALTASRSVAPYAVGVIEVTYTDTTRSTDARGENPPSPSRQLPVTIRYPVAGAASDPETAGAPAQVGSFPLVVFAHGFDVSAATYATFEHQLAAAGFVVAAPDFPLTSSAFGGPPIESDVSNQAGDVSFVITSMRDPRLVPQPLIGAIAPTKVGVIGHSDGGVTAAAVAYNSTVADVRIGAAVILSGAEARYDGDWFTLSSPPLLAIHGTDDEVNPYASSTVLFDGATGPKILVSVTGGSHLGPFTTDPSEPDIATLAADFFHAYLETDISAASRLPTDANIDSELTLTAQG